MKNCDQGLENAAERLRGAFSSPLSYLFTTATEIVFTDTLD